MLKDTGKQRLVRELPENRRRTEVPGPPYWQPWCRRSAQLLQIKSLVREQVPMNARASKRRSRIPASHRRARKFECLITSVKTNPTCAVSNTAGTRLKMTATFLLDLFPVSRCLTEISQPANGTMAPNCNKGRTEHFSKPASGVEGGVRRSTQTRPLKDECHDGNHHRRQ